MEDQHLQLLTIFRLLFKFLQEMTTLYFDRIIAVRLDMEKSSKKRLQEITLDWHLTIL